MIDEKGYIKLIDFGISEKLKNSQSASTTIVGTYEMMAPEMILQMNPEYYEGGYDVMVDWWMLGILIYTLIFGKNPFNLNCNKDDNQLLKNILQRLYLRLHYAKLY